MAATPVSIRAPLGFRRAEDVAPDEERSGLLRARTLPFDTDPSVAFEYRLCTLTDLSESGETEPGLEDAGFQTIDLSANAPLQRALATIREEDRLTDESVAALRASLAGAELPLGGGRRLRIEHVADEGLIHRRAGPAGLEVNPGGMQGANGHGAAPAIHGDQDVFGTPLRQMMNGDAPKMFRHRTPDGRNDDSPLWLLNLWIPIQQITRPLVLMDRRTLDQKRHQLRYGLPVTRFLDREEDSKVNDIWAFLHHPDQEWYFHSSMGPERAYVFDTLGEPHGASVLPGEDALERLYAVLAAAIEAAADADVGALREVAQERVTLEVATTAPVRGAFDEMNALLAEAGAAAGSVCAAGSDWTARSRMAMDRTVRKSVEMRLVATLSGG